MIRGILIAAVCAVPLYAGDLPQPLDPGDFRSARPGEAELGQLLFYDRILSGNRSVSCATCHHPRFATGDGISLGIGDGGIGIGPDRTPDPGNMPEQRVPRNAPPLFNLGHSDVTVLFADGRIELDPTRPSGIRTPLADEMVTGFSGLLSAQTMFPVLSPDEMAGHYQENDVAKAVRQGRLTGDDGAWDLIADRVAKIPEYVDRFASVYPDRDGIAFTDISDAIAAFMAEEWRADNSPFDRHLSGERTLTGAALRGLDLFFGSAGCSACHSGPLLSDMQFHAMAAPQIGPGKAERFESHRRDTGRMRVTGKIEDIYAFRTPMLRNVAETGPWGHAGAHSDLRAFLSDHADPVGGLARYTGGALLPDGPFNGDQDILEDAVDRQAIADAVRSFPVDLDEDDLDDLVAFLNALTDPGALGGRLGVPNSVPSGLPVER